MAFCKYCGTENENGAKFCSNCGKELAGSSNYEFTNDPNVSDDLKRFTSTESANVSPRSRAVAAILAWCFGWIGVHQFYLGKVGSGIAMVLFFWTGIPAIIGFIQFIIILCGEARDVDGKEVRKW